MFVITLPSHSNIMEEKLKLYLVFQQFYFQISKKFKNDNVSDSEGMAFVFPTECSV